MRKFLEESAVFDYSHPSLQAFLGKAISRDSKSAQDQARELYYAVRDGINYEVFGTDIGKPGLQGSSIVQAGKGFCLHKSILYVTACRAAGIPARLQAATVENHLSTPELELLVGGTTFLHWFTEIYLHGKWIKVTPVFGKLLCRVYGMEPLEFDAFADSVHQVSNHGGQMRFLSQPHLPASPDYDSMISLIKDHHPLMVNGTGTVPTAAAMAAEGPQNLRTAHAH